MNQSGRRRDNYESVVVIVPISLKTAKISPFSITTGSYFGLLSTILEPRSIDIACDRTVNVVVREWLVGGLLSFKRKLFHVVVPFSMHNSMIIKLVISAEIGFNFERLEDQY